MRRTQALDTRVFQDIRWGVMTAVSSSPIPAAGQVRFLGSEGAYWRLRLKGAALVVVTLGIYRFWLATDARRFLWSNTEISGDTLEYNGLATELLVGFLFAVAILVPLYMAFALVALELDIVALRPAMIGFALLLLLGEYALYRARRYRLTRTVFRGLRFDQHGSPWRYALYALVCWGIVIVTLGLAYPWTAAFIERFKMRNTSYGDLQGRFEGRGLALFLRGLPMWLVIVGPIVVALGVLSAQVDWDALSRLMDQGDDDAFQKIGEMLAPGVGVAIAAISMSFIALPLLYPVFQAVKLRWWISGLRFGDVAVTSRLRIRQVYRVYLRLLLYLFLLGLLAGIMGAMLASVVVGVVSLMHNATVIQVVGAAIGLLLYVVFMIGSSTVYQVIVAAGLWRLGTETAALSGEAALDGVRATGTASSALGEGLADALGVGSI
jgi:uncharacterized membrane protein YjgN (DUF898 family)